MILPYAVRDVEFGSAFGVGADFKVSDRRAFVFAVMVNVRAILACVIICQEEIWLVASVALGVVKPFSLRRIINENFIMINEIASGFVKRNHDGVAVGADNRNFMT